MPEQALKVGKAIDDEIEARKLKLTELRDGIKRRMLKIDLGEKATIERIERINGLRIEIKDKV